jgi:hypothetical protein
MPVASQLLAQREYVECERKKEVNCETSCIEIKCNSTDTFRMYVFKFNASGVKDKQEKENDLFMEEESPQASVNEEGGSAKDEASAYGSGDVRAALLSKSNSNKQSAKQQPISSKSKS